MRRLWVLVSQLPKGCAFHRSIDPEQSSWRLEHQLQALAIETNDLGFRQLWSLLAAVNTPKGKKPPKPWEPIEIPRPGVHVKEPPPPLTMADIRRRFQGG